MPGSANASADLSGALYQHRQDPSEASSVWGKTTINLTSFFGGEYAFFKTSNSGAAES